MFRKLAVAVVVMVLSAGSVAQASGANRLYDSPGDETFEARSPFFDVFFQREPGIIDDGDLGVIDNGDPGIIDDGDPGVMSGAFWLKLLMSMGW